MAIVINPEFKDRRVCHNKTNKTVGTHTPAELKQLAILARKSDNRILLECFIELPTLEELIDEKTVTELAAVKPAPAKAEDKKVVPEVPKP